MLRNSTFHPRTSRSVYVSAPDWKPSLASPHHQERVQTPWPRGRGRSQPSSFSQASSLTPFISQERLSCAPLTTPTFTGLPQGSSFLTDAMCPLWACGEFCLLWPLEDSSWRRFHRKVCLLLSWLGWGWGCGGGEKMGNYSWALRGSTWKWHTALCLCIIGQSKSHRHACLWISVILPSVLKGKSQGDLWNSTKWF